MRSTTEMVFVFLFVVVAAIAGCDRASHADGDRDHRPASQDHEGDHEHGEDQDDHREHAGEDRGDHEVHDDIVRLTAAVMAEFGVDVATAGPGELTLDLSLPGEVVVNPDRVVHIVPRVPSIAQRVSKSIGDVVEEGELLAEIESAELAEVKAKYLAKSKALELARIDFQRQQTIHDNTEKMLELLKQSPALEALGELENLDLGTHRSELLPAYAEYVVAKVEYGRQQRLRKDEISSEANLQAARNRYEQGWARYLSIRDELIFQNRRRLDGRRRTFEVARFELSSARQHLHTLGLLPQRIDRILDENDVPLSHLEMRAPIGGTIIERHITKGEKLAEDTTAFLIADLSEVWVHLTVYQKDLSRVRPGQPVVIAFGHGIPDAHGVIDYVSPLIEEQTRTATARVVLKNPQGVWRPGLFVEGRIEVSNTQVPIRVPMTALITMDAETVVFVETEDGFRPQHVAVGRSNRTHVEIINGLQPGQRYVTKNVITLKAEMGKGSMGGHQH